MTRLRAPGIPVLVALCIVDLEARGATEWQVSIKPNQVQTQETS